jgi:hypothetical protein
MGSGDMIEESLKREWREFEETLEWFWRGFEEIADMSDKRPSTL